MCHAQQDTTSKKSQQTRYKQVPRRLNHTGVFSQGRSHRLLGQIYYNRRTT